jgi:hypothetical protein
LAPVNSSPPYSKGARQFVSCTGDEHILIGQRARQALGLVLHGAGAGTVDPLALERACKLANFLTQSFFCAEPWTKRPGSHVSLAESLRTCAEILDGVHDELPTAAFNFAGGRRLSALKAVLGGGRDLPSSQAFKGPLLA